MKFVLQTLFENKNKNYQYICLKEFEDTKGVTRIHISKKNIQYNGNNKDKRTINDLESTTQKTKDKFG